MEWIFSLCFSDFCLFCFSSTGLPSIPGPYHSCSPLIAGGQWEVGSCLAWVKSSGGFPYIPEPTQSGSPSCRVGTGITRVSLLPTVGPHIRQGPWLQRYMPDGLLKNSWSLWSCHSGHSTFTSLPEEVFTPNFNSVFLFCFLPLYLFNFDWAFVFCPSLLVIRSRGRTCHAMWVRRFLSVNTSCLRTTVVVFVCALYIGIIIIA